MVRPAVITANRRRVSPASVNNRSSEIHAYLAGPDVFMTGAEAIGKRKKQILADAGIVGHYPLDSGLNLTELGKTMPPEQLSDLIAMKCEQMMDETLQRGGIAVIFANMSPWHGSLSMDVGTAFEMGYYSRMAREHPGRVLIMGYYDDPKDLRPMIERLAKRVGPITKDAAGVPRDPNGNEVEDYNRTDNSMMVHACHKTGGSVHPSLQEAVAAAKSVIEQRMTITGRGRSATRG
jgi:nucleoside 2-deoxyribosyltransferase